MPADGPDPVAFSVTLDSGAVVTTRRLIVASGAVDVLPDVPGLAEQWGRGVVHCPFCHGWEVRDQRIGVLVTSPNGTHHALMFRALSDRVTAFVTDPALVDAEGRAGLAARGITVVDDRVTRVESVDGQLTGVRLGSGRSWRSMPWRRRARQRPGSGSSPGSGSRRRTSS